MGILEKLFGNGKKNKIEKTPKEEKKDNPCAEYRNQMAKTIPEEIPEDMIDEACGCTPREQIVNHLPKPTISIKGNGR